MLESPLTTTQTLSNPRKRKKRTPVAGAAADCFTCAEHNFACDRRRPYCSQCLSAGQDCSGYKTQLTWNVGVASRGKLRGLFLPVAGTQKIPSETQQPKTKKRKESRPRVHVTPCGQPPSLEVQEQRYGDTHISQGEPARTSPERLAQVLTPSTHQGAIWDPTFFSAPHTVENQELSQTASQPQSQNFYSIPSLSSSSYPNGSHGTCISFRNDIWQPQPATTTRYLTPHDTVPTTPISPGITSSTTYFSSASNHPTTPGLVSPGQLTFPRVTRGSIYEQVNRPLDGISMLLQADQSMQTPQPQKGEAADEEIKRELVDECAVSDDFSLLSASSPLNFTFSMPLLSGVSNIGKTTRMQYLINYYAEVISPVIVAFDSPTNPFRTQILRLAQSSETLQHAISALAASNLRQRRGIGLLSTGKTAPARRSSFAHVHLSNDFFQELLSPEDQMQEETLHKRLAVSQLNQQLAHPVLRMDDSILATLLILCLFHICDSGIAKFQTQFAGVRKLLALRGDDVGISGEDSKWMSRLFTWFDSLAATVNDREAQITGHYLDISALCGDWSLENMAGVDASLFKSIAKLGRLNLLRQGKEVTPGQPSVPRPAPNTAFSATTYATLDGNGWMPIDVDDETGTAKSSAECNRRFWKEWHEVRNELLAWSLDTTLFDSLSRESSCLTISQRADLDNISQSFRYSALLYLERLAQPQLPLADETIQRWVRQSLGYIKKVESDVYLLWPLFITGTECVDEEGRNVIRGRCADIQKDSGFVNNASCLQLLEKVWREHSPDSSPRTEIGSMSSSRSSPDQGSFIFRDVMIREAARMDGDGEYIVV